jgi:hypothetical protein
MAGRTTKQRTGQFRIPSEVPVAVTGARWDDAVRVDLVLARLPLIFRGFANGNTLLAMRHSAPSLTRPSALWPLTTTRVLPVVTSSGMEELA